MVEFYANPSIIYFTITLTAHDSSCKPVNSSDWVKKLLKQKSDVPCVDIDLDFGGGKYFASLRLSRGSRGTLEVVMLSLLVSTVFLLVLYITGIKHILAFAICSSTDISPIYILLNLISISYLQAAIFTSYSLKNDTDFGLCFFVLNKRPLSR